MSWFGSPQVDYAGIMQRHMVKEGLNRLKHMVKQGAYKYFGHYRDKKARASATRYASSKQFYGRSTKVKKRSIYSKGKFRRYKKYK